MIKISFAVSSSLLETHNTLILEAAKPFINKVAALWPTLARIRVIVSSIGKKWGLEISLFTPFVF
ncbi:MAG: hypothetical protein PH343_03110 [Nitrospira sp.]|nr:hypothetical protein [Nitrospira sp.]